jgi:hypothetical protein
MAGFCATPSFLSSHRVLEHFGPGSEDERRRLYAAHVLQNSADEETRIATFRSRQRVIGTREFKLAVLNKGAPPSVFRTSQTATLGFI